MRAAPPLACLAALATACVTPLTLGPPRALPAGATEIAAVAVPAASSAALHRYDALEPGDPAPGAPVAEPEPKDVPPRGSGTLVVVGRRGLGAAVDGELLYLGLLGLGAGLRVQLAGGDDAPLCAGLGVRATASAFGAGSTGDSGSLAGGDVQLYGTVAYARGDLALYAGPRVHLAWLRASRERDGRSDTARTSALGAGATAGVALAPLVVELSGLRMVRGHDDRATYHLVAAIGVLLRR